MLFYFVDLLPPCGHSLSSLLFNLLFSLLNILFIHIREGIVGFVITFIHHIPVKTKSFYREADKQASMLAPRFNTQSEQSSKQPY